MRLTIDTHIHSNNSYDANGTVDEMCQTGIDKGFDTLCFMEHVDMNPHHPGYMYFNHDQYTHDINYVREKYAGRITILQGVEFGEPHMFPNTFENILRYDFDFVLGSIHWSGENFVPDKNFQEQYPCEQIYEMYYQEVMKAITLGGFDSLAHIDFPKKYLLTAYEPLEMMNEILNALVKRGIALEINSSPIRKGYSDVNPSDSIVEMYTSHGGRNVTIGSDAHSCEEIGQDFNRIGEKIMKYQLQVTNFINRKPVVVGMA